jgi:hypothetical protein
VGGEGDEEGLISVLQRIVGGGYCILDEFGRAWLPDDLYVECFKKNGWVKRSEVMTFTTDSIRKTPISVSR